MVTESAYMSEVEACSQSKQRISPVSLQEQGNFGNSRHNLLTPDSVAAGRYLIPYTCTSSLKLSCAVISI